MCIVACITNYIAIRTQTTVKAIIHYIEIVAIVVESYYIVATQ